MRNPLLTALRFCCYLPPPALLPLLLFSQIYHGSTFAQDPDGIGCNPMKSYCDPTILKVVKAYNAHCAVPKEAFFPLPGPGYCRSQTVDYREVCTPPGTARKAPERPRNVDPNRVRSPIDPSTVPPEALGAMFTRTRVD